MIKISGSNVARTYVRKGMVGISVILMTCTGCQGNGSRKTEDTLAGSNSIAREEGVGIQLDDSGITAGNHWVNIEDNGVTITKAGTYILSGRLSDGRIVVDAGEDDVTLVLKGVDITAQDCPPIQIRQAGEATIYLADNTVNRLTDGEDYETEEGEMEGVISSRGNLKLDGEGDLYINGNRKHGIAGQEDLRIQGGTYIIQTVEDGISANNNIIIDNGTFVITAGDDGIHADEMLTIQDGTVTIAKSEEGLEGHQVIINGGEIDITASDDGINSNCGSSSASEDSGEMTPMENEGMTEEAPELPQGGQPELPEGERPEPPQGGQPELPEGERPEPPQGEQPELPEGEAPEPPQGNYGGNEELPDRERPEGAASENKMPEGEMPAMGADTDPESLLQINGGTITVNAGGDGLDSNGILEITGGTIYVSGAANHGDAAIDYGIDGRINGGTIIAAGFSGMAEDFGRSSAQISFLYNTAETRTAGTQLRLEDSNGKELLSWAPVKEYNSIVISSPDLKENETYRLRIGEETETLKQEAGVNE